MTDSLRTPANALMYFSLLVAQEESLPLAETAAHIAQIECNPLPFHLVINELDRLCLQARRQIGMETPALKKIGRLNLFFFRELNFRGSNTTRENISLSCINWVLKTRRGTDVLLSIIYLEIAKALGLHARSIALPERFLIKIHLNRPSGAPAEVIIDPMNGQSLNMQDIHALLAPYKKQHGLVDEFDIPDDLFLEAITKKEIIASILTHMRTAYQEQEDWSLLVQVLDRLITLYPGHMENYRERGYALIKNGQPAQAAIDLNHYLQHVKKQPVNDADIVMQQLNSLRDWH